MFTATHACFAISPRLHLTIPDLTIHAGQCWTIIGGNGSGKTALARALCGELSATAGTLTGTPTTASVSFEQQQALFEDEFKRGNTDMLSDDEDPGRTVDTLIAESGATAEARQQTATLLGIGALLHRPIRVLSSGEGRKALLARALLTPAELLVLDEPFDGLDVEARAGLTTLLNARHARGDTQVIIVNRFDEIIDATTHIGLLDQLQLVVAQSRTTLDEHALIQQLQHGEQSLNMPLPPPLVAPAPLPDGPLVVLRNGHVAHDGNLILDQLNWTVDRGQHWQIHGPNGAGKSTLLALVCGDHPQGYSNDLTLFGRRRGSGETIWDIKSRIGMVTPALHLAYRVSTTPKKVILSGYYDSIGVYQKPADNAVKLASDWLAVLGMSALADTPFHSLSFGQQRLLLIVRALVKHPPLLVLDEPLQGLDALNRKLVLQFIDRLVEAGSSQLLFVSHHAEDAPRAITHRLAFVANGDSGFRVEQTCVADGTTSA